MWMVSGQHSDSLLRVCPADMVLMLNEEMFLSPWVLGIIPKIYSSWRDRQSMLLSKSHDLTLIIDFRCFLNGMRPNRCRCWNLFGHVRSPSSFVEKLIQLKIYTVTIPIDAIIEYFSSIIINIVAGFHCLPQNFLVYVPDDSKNHATDKYFESVAQSI
jgi:hypothetical protein